ncbi:hypothetical protein DL771_004924 [Monosporascus sp. 5C6A]|nr:hypothetical protein DL771_004924 [Monosporascus sp. 5C6A]
MAALRRAIALNAGAVARLQSQTFIARSRSLSLAVSQFRAHTSTRPRRQHACQSQLESTPNSAVLLSSQRTGAPGSAQTLTEKILQRYSVGLAPGKKVKAGDYISLCPHHCMTHDNSWAVAAKFMDIGASKIHNNRQVVMALDHNVQDKSEANLKRYRQIQEFARKHGVDFYPAGRGIGHQIMVEEGYAWPGTVTGTPLVRTDAASIWATGRTWLQIPPIAKVTFHGILPPGVTGKDVIVALCGLLNQDEVLNHAIEFTGSEQTMRSIPIDDRLTIANMTTEWGALSGLFPVDETLISWYRAKATTAAVFDSPSRDRINHKRIDEIVENRLVADPGATYAKELYVSLSTLSPFVAGPNSVKVVTPLKNLETQDIYLDKAYIISCTNGRASDFRAAARVFREAATDAKPAKIASGVNFYIAAASIPEQQIAEEAGDWQVLLDSGAQPLPAGCGPCIGLGTGLLEDGEVGISASNRNFPGRMGSTKSKAYLVSPEVVAASALQGKIAGPGWYQKPSGVEKVIIGEGSGDHIAGKAPSIEDTFDKIIGKAENTITSTEDADGQSSSPTTAEDETLTGILPGFPEKIEGKYTYQDNLTKEKMAEVCMENYDTEFRTTAKAGDILVTGFNFGCGSSREQAATSILAKQIPLVVAGSFGNIFSRNSINNGLMNVEAPRLVQRLRETYKDDAAKPLTRRTGWKLLWDVHRSKVVITEKDGSSWEQKVGEVPPSVQEIIARGGLEKWVKSQIEA